MSRMDKSIKTMLGLIALFLGVIAFRPLMDPATSAEAQVGSTETAPASQQSTASRATLLTRITFRDAVQGVTPMDQSGVFLVHTKNMVEVYRVDGAGGSR